MSVVFEAADLQDAGLPTLEPCLCTQMDERFLDWMQYGAGEASEMRKAASPQCHVCRGTGIEHALRPTIPGLNFSNDAARILLSAMFGGDVGLQGETTIAKARRGIMRARNTKIVVPQQPHWAGVFKGARFIGADITVEGLLERLDRFENFVNTVAQLGAKKIRWY